MNLTELALGNYSDSSDPAATFLPDLVEGTPPLKIAHDILIVCLLVAVMFAMGCHITFNEIWNHIKRPVGVIIGMTSQFVLLPLSAFGLMTVLKLDPLHATGMLVLSCSPGGVTSNIFSYFCDGDVSLSVTMTTCSSIVALGMMPFNMWLYGHQLDTGHLIIPYDKMSVSLAAVTAPVCAGMFIRWKAPKFAPYITKAGSYAGFLIIFICQGMELIIFPDIFNGIGWEFYLALFTLPAIGLFLGYGLALLFGQVAPVRKTIAIECSIQNIGTALTVISLSFPLSMQKMVLAFPWLYSIPLLSTVTICCIFYQIYKRFWLKEEQKKPKTMQASKMDQIVVVTDEEAQAFIIEQIMQPKIVSSV